MMEALGSGLGEVVRYQFSREQLQFQQQVEDFLADKLPSEVATKVRNGASVSKAELTDWTRTLNAQGWAAPNWPEQYGGTGWNLTYRHIFDVACRRHHAPAYPVLASTWLAAIIKYGSEAQKAEFLPKIRNADLWFCQYSEPQAGSDLASVRTRASVMATTT